MLVGISSLLALSCPALRNSFPEVIETFTDKEPEK